MGKQYYCDFCDKSFADNANNRKNHLKGIHHQRMRKLHYDSFRDANIILAEERSKKSCVHFHQSGSCSFGVNCRYSHLTPERLQELEKVVMEQQGSKKRKYLDDPVPKLEDWLVKRKKKYKTNNIEEVTNKKVLIPEYHLPSHLSSLTNLPPSVLPPRPDVLNGLPLEEWG